MWGLGIVKGLGITMRNWLRGPITVRYPDERLPMPERSRWALAPRYDEAGAPKCTACLVCVRECPDFILHLDVTVGPDGGKHINAYDYEIGACMMCGLCVEACPYDAIEMSHEFELAVKSPDGLRRVLLTDVDAAPIKRAKPADAVPEAKGGADA